MGSIKVEGMYSDVVNFAMQQNHVPIIRSLKISNIHEEDIRDIKIKITFEPAFAYEWTASVDLIPAEQSLLLEAINVKLSPDFLYGLTEKISGNIKVKIESQVGEIYSHIEEIDILAYDEWSGLLIMPEIVTAFITPNNGNVTQIIIEAKQFLKEWCENPAFTGYQSNDTNTIRMQMAAIYAALQKKQISYCMPPASYEFIGQRIRLIDNILTNKLGTCLDLSLLYASCLEAIGLNPIIIFIKSHAFVGCWLEDECFAECIQDDITLITKRIADGINQICLVECTSFVDGKIISFENAEMMGKNNLQNQENFQLLVDIKRSRGSGIRPIPLRIGTSEGFILEQLDKTSSDNTFITNAPSALETFDKVQYVNHIEITKKEMWERKLLDLSLRNTLVNFRVTQNTIQIMTSDLFKIEDALADGHEFQIMPKPQDFVNSIRDTKIFEIENNKNLIESIVETEFKNKRIRTFIEERDVAYRITSLYRNAKVSLEENGTNTLYLALGLLRWFESDVSKKVRYAPIVLLPIEIVRKSAQRGYVIRIRDEEPQMNITLLEMLRQDFGITIDGLDPLPIDESGVDLKRVFHIIRQVVMNQSRWDVEELAFMGLFSFSQFIMWNDLKNRSGDILQNKVVASLVSGNLEWETTHEFPNPDTLDSVYAATDIAIPISADSSQLSAICAAGEGRSFVLHGPPGTGKSQTITNIIANALFQGKSVLFIAEKMAALSVVEKRLASIGLGPFCLEVHSNKAKKKDVLTQLDEVLNIGKYKSPAEYEEKAQRLSQLRQDLNEIVKEIHRKHKSGFSLYEAVSMFEQYENSNMSITFTKEQIRTVTPERYKEWTDTLNRIRVAGIDCGGVSNSLLKEIKRLSYTQSLKNELETNLQRLRELVEKLDRIVHKAQISVEIKTFKQIKAFVRLFVLIQNMSNMTSTLFKCGNLHLLKDKVEEVCRVGKLRDEEKRFLLSKFTESIFTFDSEKSMQEWKSAELKWFLPKMLEQGKLVKNLKILAKKPEDVTKSNYIELMELLSGYKAHSNILTENSALFTELYGLYWNDSKADWNTIETMYNNAVKGNECVNNLSEDMLERSGIRKYIADECIPDLAEYRERNAEMAAKAQDTFDEIVKQKEEISAITGIDFGIYEQSGNWTNELIGKCDKWLSAIDELKNWSTYLMVKEEMIELGIANVVLELEDGVITEQNITEAFYSGFAKTVTENLIDESTLLSTFSGALLEEKIRAFKQVCAEFEELTRNELAARLSANVPSGTADYASSSEVGILQRAIKSGGRMMSIRKLFDSIPNLLSRLCPCILMSPISVAQYIDPSYPSFDLVIFDEASQLPTCKAVGAIARGKNLIVVGDPKQLPPTSFFSTNQIDEDNYEKEDLESILDDCIAISMPQMHLLWHYRSKHESLIAFSNMQYYENKLFTFPSPNDLVSEVKLVEVEGYYDRGKTKQNRSEAEAVVAEILKRLRDPILSIQSIGVVTFSSVQQNLIDDLLTEAFAKNPELDEFNSRQEEPIFIKNLENVQGDERDVILFSIGYGSDDQGKVTLNFGPLNRDGGWRRLNVAVSRARRTMIVYSTLKPEQIDLTKTRADGLAGLKAFLEFAGRGKSVLASKSADNLKSSEGIERTIAKKIALLGYDVKTNIGCSEYKVDIGIINPSKQDEYILGIICDGENYRRSSTARDRNLLQESVLNSLGWNTYRLWVLEWWENPKRQLEKIKMAVDEALSKKPKTETIQPIIQKYSLEKITDEPGLVQDLLPQYTVCELAAHGKQGDEFYLPQNRNLIIKQIEKVLEIEAPISKEILCRRILHSWNISRMGTRLEERFDMYFSQLGIQQTVSYGEKFLWDKSQNPEEYKEVRVSSNLDEKRNMEEIPAIEIANAIEYIVKRQVGLLKEDLVKETYKLFGFTRGSSNIDRVVEEGLRNAISRNRICINEYGKIVAK